MNLIVTCPRHYEHDAAEEMRDILGILGDSDPDMRITKISGILTARTSLDPVDAVRRIRDMLLDEPWCIRYCMRIIPIQKAVGTTLEEIEEAVAGLSGRILDGETYRVSIEKRNTEISGRAVISRLADLIDGTVSLDFPDKIVLVEILGSKTGISVLTSSDILSVEKTKRSMSGQDGGLLD